jgi:hypothetical protein
VSWLPYLCIQVLKELKIMAKLQSNS